MSELFLKEAPEYILFEYEMRKNRRPSYSLRAFARDLNFSPSSLSDFLKGRVGMSEQRILHLAETLVWSEERREHFQDLVTLQHSKSSSERNDAQMRVNRRIKEKSTIYGVEKFKLISNWYTLVIVELCHLLQNITPQQISNRLSISLVEAKNSLKQLEKINILQKTKNGFKPTHQSFQFGDEIPSEAIRHFHFQVMQQAQEALISKDMSQRESHSLVFSMKSRDRQKMNQEIRKALYKIVNKYAAEDECNTVQIVSLQSFNPLSEDSIGPNKENL
jgi:uncharacterized protein (TIGR02147 family)